MWTGAAHNSLEWTQTRNPLSGNNEDMSPTDIKLLPVVSEPLVDFIGLSISANHNTFLSGSSSGWWYSVGYVNTYRGGNPAVRTGDGGSIASKTELFVFIPATTTTPGIFGIH